MRFCLLTRWGAFSSRKTEGNCVANGSVLMNEYDGARVGMGNMETLVKGSASARYWTRSVISSWELAFISIFTAATTTTALDDSGRHALSSQNIPIKWPFNNSCKSHWKHHHHHDLSSILLLPACTHGHTTQSSSSSISQVPWLHYYYSISFRHNGIEISPGKIFHIKIQSEEEGGGGGGGWEGMGTVHRGRKLCFVIFF